MSVVDQHASPCHDIDTFGTIQWLVIDSIHLIGQNRVYTIIGTILEHDFGQRLQIRLLRVLSTDVKQTAVFQEDIGKLYFNLFAINQMDGSRLE